MQTQTTSVREAIAEANTTFMDAFARGDAGGVAAVYTKNGQVLPPGSTTITGREGVAAFWQGAMEQGVQRAELNTVEVDHQGDTVIEVGRAKLYSAGGAVLDEPKYLVVWKQEGGAWKIHRDIWNSDGAPVP